MKLIIHDIRDGYSSTESDLKELAEKAQQIALIPPGRYNKGVRVVMVIDDEN